MNKMKNKKGDLRDHIGDIIIGVLCLLLIIFAIVIVYRVLTNQEDANAKRALDGIEGKINALEDGQSNTFLIQGFKGAAPDNLADSWFFAGWSKIEQNKPEMCFFDSCICICKGGIEASKSALIESCMEKGFCRRFNVDNIKVGTNWRAGIYANSGIDAKSEYIRLENNLLDVKITKQKNSLELNHDDYTETR